MALPCIQPYITCAIAPNPTACRKIPAVVSALKENEQCARAAAGTPFDSPWWRAQARCPGRNRERRM